MLTNILIRPAARGGKYLGPDAANSDNQSAYVTLRNTTTDEIYSGYVNTLKKDPGPPDSIMSPVARNQPFPTDATTIGLTFQVPVNEPTIFELTIIGPLKFAEQARTVKAQINVLPGVDIGQNVHSTNALEPSYPEGLVIEVPGLAISEVQASLGAETLSCLAKVTMMCGCEINDTPSNWFWPPVDFQIQLQTYMKSGKVYHYPMTYDANVAGPSFFSGNWNSLAAPGDQILNAWITAAEPKLGNQGFYKLKV